MKKWIKNEKTLHTVPSLSGIPITIGSIAARLALKGEALTNTNKTNDIVGNPKMSKEPSSPSRSNALTADPNKTKICSKLTRK